MGDFFTSPLNFLTNAFKVGFGQGDPNAMGSPMWQFFGAASPDVMNQALAGQQGNVANATNLMNAILGQTMKQYGALQPLQSSVIQRATDIMGGNYNPASSPAYGPMRRSVEQSYQGARENILSSLPTGGTQQQALADLEMNKAANLSDVMGQILTGELQNAFGLGTGAFGQYLQGMGAAQGASGLTGQMQGSILEYLANLMSQAGMGKIL